MAAQKEFPELKNYICEKCSSVMVKRVLPVKDSPTLDFINIMQCNTCRFYFELVVLEIIEPEILLPESKELLINKAYDLGIQYEKKYAGCAQTIVAAIFEALGIWSEDIFKATTGLANGLGLTGEESCAALLGASMVISYLFGRDHEDFKDEYEPMKSYALVKRLHNIFIRKYGACQCRNVQSKQFEVTWKYEERYEMKGHLRTHMIDFCSEIVGNIAKIATKIILENGYNPKSK